MNLKWNFANLVDEFEVGNGQSLLYRYDPNGMQYLKINRTSTNISSNLTTANITQILTNKNYNQLTFSIGKEYEELYDANEHTFQQRIFIYAYGKLIAINSYATNNFNMVNLSNRIVMDTKYIHQDMLDSIDTITNQSGSIISSMRYNAFGKIRVRQGKYNSIKIFFIHKL